MNWNDVAVRAMNFAGELPLILILTVVVGFFLAPRMYPGGCLRYLTGIIVVLLIVLSLKQLFGAAFPSHDWPYRPKLPELEWVYGFPSSHAATMAFFTTTIAVVPCGFSHPRRIIFALIMGLMTLVVCAQRYQTQAHTMSQILAGVLIGCVLGFVYAAVVPVRSCPDDKCCL